MISNPPYGKDWKKEEPFVKEEADRGTAGRFGAGLPRISDGQLLFLQQMISKMKPVSEGGSRIAIVMNGSPLFTGDAGSGESEIRRWILPEFLIWLLEGIKERLLALIEDSAHGTKCLRTDQWKTFEVFLPTIDEQRTICRHLDHYTDRLRTIISKARQQIERLQEFRTALISATVTGKIDVR